MIPRFDGIRAVEACVDSAFVGNRRANRHLNQHQPGRSITTATNGNYFEVISNDSLLFARFLFTIVRGRATESSTLLEDNDVRTDLLVPSEIREETSTDTINNDILVTHQLTRNRWVVCFCLVRANQNIAARSLCRQREERGADWFSLEAT